MIRLLVKGRQMGKTHDLVEEFRKDKKGIILVPSEIMRIPLIRKYGISEEKVISLLDLVRRKEICSTKNIYIDDADFLLRALVNDGSVKMMTATDIRVDAKGGKKP